jgi:hypothetical protein
MSTNPEDAHAYISAFCDWLAVRPDGERVRQRLAEAFVEHRDELWPQGEASATPTWIADNIDGILGTIERLYSVAVETDTAGAQEFLDRMSWLPPLLVELHQWQTLDG